MGSANVKEGWVELHDFAREVGVLPACLFRGIRGPAPAITCVTTADGRMLRRDEAEDWVLRELCSESPREVERPMGTAQAAALLGITPKALRNWWEDWGAQCPIGAPEKVGKSHSWAWLKAHVEYVRTRRQAGVGVSSRSMDSPRVAEPHPTPAHSEITAPTGIPEPSLPTKRGRLIRSGALRGEMKTWLAGHPEASHKTLAESAGVSTSTVSDILSGRRGSVTARANKALRRAMRKWDGAPADMSDTPPRVTIAEVNARWHEMPDELKRMGRMPVGACIRVGRPATIIGDRLVVVFKHIHAFHHGKSAGEYRAVIEQAMERLFGKAFLLEALLMVPDPNVEADFAGRLAIASQAPGPEVPGIQQPYDGGDEDECGPEEAPPPLLTLDGTEKPGFFITDDMPPLTEEQLNALAIDGILRAWRADRSRLEELEALQAAAMADEESRGGPETPKSRIPWYRRWVRRRGAD